MPVNRKAVGLVRKWKYWVTKAVLYVIRFGPIAGPGLFTKHWFVDFDDSLTHSFNGVTYRHIHADVMVFEKFYVYRDLDKIIRRSSQYCPAPRSMLDLGANIGLAARRFLEITEGARTSGRA